MGPIIRASGTILYSLSFLNSGLGLTRLKHVYTVISVIVDSLPANTMSGIDKFVDGQSAISRIVGGASRSASSRLLKIVGLFCKRAL